ncbi:MAG: hypothetical protein ACYCSS_01840 [Sulfuriferula sp.]
MNEAKIRLLSVEPALKLTGWGVVEDGRAQRGYLIMFGRLECTGNLGKLFTVDPVLENRNTELTTVEDKAVTESMAQTKTYAIKLMALKMKAWFEVLQ